MMKNNSYVKVLVLGVGGNVSQGILKALKRLNYDMKIIGACVTELNYGYLLCDEKIVSPYANDKRFIPWLIDTCNKKKIDIVFSGVEEILFTIQKNIDYINSKTKSILVISSYDKLLMTNDKYLTCEWLKNNGCNYPKYDLCKDKKTIDSFIKKNGYPVIVKPRIGKGSKGLSIIKNVNDKKEIVINKDNIIEEYIGSSDSEYTVGCYMDKQENIYCIVFKRLLKAGTTAYAKVVKNKVIEKEAIKICKALKPTGPLNIQLRMHKGKPVCFDINLRFSGTVAIRDHFGFKEIKATIDEYLFNKKVNNLFSVSMGEAYRFDEEYYIDK